MNKKLIAGLFLLNLASVSLDSFSSETSISDAEVLKQLVELRNFIDDKRDFTKQSSKDLKPVLIKYRAGTSKFDGIVQGNLSFNTDALHLSIGAVAIQKDGTPLTITINVVYEWTAYVGYTINSAKLLATKDFKVDSLNGISSPSVKPVYWHTIHFVRGSDDSSSPAYSYDIAMGYCIILNNSPTLLTLSDFISLLETDGFCAVVINGSHGLAGDFENATNQLNTIAKSDTPNSFDAYIENRTTHQITLVTLSLTEASISLFEDLGANKIN